MKNGIERDLFDSYDYCSPKMKSFFSLGTRQLYSEYQQNSTWWRQKPNSSRESKVEDDGIEYILNNLHHRALDDDPETNSIVFLGCSDTFGVGNELENTWPYLVKTELDRKGWNLGNPGGGIDSCYENFKRISSKIKFDLVFFLVPSFFRRTIWMQHIDHAEGERLAFTGNTKHIPDLRFRSCSVPQEDSAIQLALNHNCLLSSCKMAIDGIENICNKAGARLIYILHPMYYVNDISDEIYKYAPFSKAADNNHLGPDFQKVLAETFLKLYKK